MASSGLRKMSFLLIFQHLMVYEYFVDTMMLLYFFMADVMPYVLKAYGVPWQMLLPYTVADVIAMLCVVDGINRGRWYYLLLSKVADVSTIILCVADSKPTKFACCN